MICCDVKKLKEDMNDLLDKVIEENEVIQISTQSGKVIMLSDEEYRGMVERIYLNSIPGMAESITEGMNTPIEELINEDEVEW